MDTNRVCWGNLSDCLWMGLKICFRRAENPYKMGPPVDDKILLAGAWSRDLCD